MTGEEQAILDHHLEPRDNWGIIGNQWAVSMLRQHIRQGAARHAYLFTGPPGIGRRTLALRFAKALNCTTPLPSGDPCGQCLDCKTTLARKHPDVTFLEAAAEGGVLRVDSIRELRRLLVLKPFQGKYRIAILTRFQEANESASNALLKTLEEAPAHAVLVLTADSGEALLPTIVSRCEVLRLRPAPIADVERLLQQRGADPARARLAAHVSAGCPGAALALVDDKEALEFRRERLADLVQLRSAGLTQRLSYAARMSGDKRSMREVLKHWLSFWRDVLWRSSNRTASIANIDCESQIDLFAHQIDLEGARLLVHRTDRAVRQLDSNVNARLLLEGLLLDWPR